jgi:hypothetical protein
MGSWKNKAGETSSGEYPRFAIRVATRVRRTHLRGPESITKNAPRSRRIAPALLVDQFHELRTPDRARRGASDRSGRPIFVARGSRALRRDSSTSPVKERRARTGPVARSTGERDQIGKLPPSFRDACGRKASQPPPVLGFSRPYRAFRDPFWSQQRKGDVPPCGSLETPGQGLAA